MPPSQLKQLKASIQARRESSGKKSQPQPNSQAQKTSQRQQQNKRPKSQGEQNRRATLLPELQRRHKVGGIIDRRIGENDPTMTPEERALQRYTKQRSKRDSMFNLEEGEGEDELTHMGRSVLSGMDSNAQDDFEESDLGLEAEDEQDEFMTPARKRRRLSDVDGVDLNGDVDSENHPDRKKSKQEVMQEVMAKSKFYKHERQQAKDEDEDVRDALDKDLPDLLTLLRGGTTGSVPLPGQSNGFSVHPDRAAQISEDISMRMRAAEKEYDLRFRQMAQDKRAQPSERTKTAEEKAEVEAARLQELENSRMRRMRGESDDEGDSDDGGDEDNSVAEETEDDFDGVEVAAPEVETETESKRPPLDVEDEDDFIIDEDLVASGSDIDSDISNQSSFVEGADSDDDSEFLRDVLPAGSLNEEQNNNVDEKLSTLPYTYSCPQTHGELLKVIRGVPVSDLPTVIQRIRALYHPQLNPQNSERLSNFAATLVEHLSFLTSQKAPLGVVESLIRHIHSLSRKYADSIANAFREQLKQMQHRSHATLGDLFILTAVCSIYPTSDHFHQVVTPAITLIGRFLGTNSPPRTDQESSNGAYLVGLALKYQALSKRYVPEALRFTIGAIKRDPKSRQSQSHIKNLTYMMDLWYSKTAFISMFSPAALQALESTGDMQALTKLRILLSQSHLCRRPLELHHHRPLPIRSAIPKFEENFNPDKHYDPDRERADSNKLRKEYKREKKGALRELKKDASFIAREKLKAKKEADKAYEIKQRRLIAEIQGEDGKEKNAYEREKRKRKGIR